MSLLNKAIFLFQDTQWNQSVWWLIVQTAPRWLWKKISPDCGLSKPDSQTHWTPDCQLPTLNRKIPGSWTDGRRIWKARMSVPFLQTQGKVSETVAPYHQTNPVIKNVTPQTTGEEQESVKLQMLPTSLVLWRWERKTGEPEGNHRLENWGTRRNSTRLIVENWTWVIIHQLHCWKLQAKRWVLVLMRKESSAVVWKIVPTTLQSKEQWVSTSLITFETFTMPTMEASLRPRDLTTQRTATAMCHAGEREACTAWKCRNLMVFKTDCSVTW